MSGGTRRDVLSSWRIVQARVEFGRENGVTHVGDVTQL
jgi:hypothetical protein